MSNAEQQQDENHIIAERRAKLAELRQGGVAFPNDFQRENTAQKLHDGYGEKSAEELEGLPVEVKVAGRMMLKRVMGKASFATLQDVSGRIQVYVARDRVGEESYAAFKGWKVEIISASEGEHGGYKEIIANIYGAGAFAHMKFESGVHRVQRVPATETQGRIHTSAATVAVLPEAEDVDIKIEDKDLRIDVYRSSGPCGQSVNTTDSAVRITHIPTGLAVAQQTEKSQLKNKNAAMKLLRARLYEIERNRIDSERSAARKDQVGSGDRSERIRTYNFPQGRCTDHRINLTLYKLDQIIEGPALEEMVQALMTNHQAELLAQQDNAI